MLKSSLKYSMIGKNKLIVSTCILMIMFDFSASQNMPMKALDVRFFPKDDISKDVGCTGGDYPTGSIWHSINAGICDPFRFLKAINR